MTERDILTYKLKDAIRIRLNTAHSSASNDMSGFGWYSTVISAAEREAAYVIDGLMHNDVVKSEVDMRTYMTVLWYGSCGSRGTCQ